MNAPALHVKTEGDVLWLTLARPEVHNAFDHTHTHTHTHTHILIIKC